MGILIIAVMFLSVWAVNTTLEKMTDKILESHKKQNEILEAIKSKLEEKSDI